MNPEPPPVINPLPRRSLAAIAAWAIIVACVVFVFIRNVRAISQLNENGSPVVALQLKFLGHMAVGTEAVLQKSGQKAPPNLTQSIDGLLQAMGQTAVSPEDKLDVAIITGEIKGSSAALVQLDELDQDKPSPAQTQDIATLHSIYTKGVDSLDAATRTSLSEHLGFFGQVALSYGVSPKAEPRLSLDEAAMKYFVRMAAVGTGFVLLMLASVVLFIIGIVMFTTGKIHRAYVPEPAANSAYLEGFALYFVAFIALGFLLRLTGVEVLPWEWLALLIIPLVMFWITRRGVPRGQMLRSLGWHWGRGPQIEIPLGIAGFFAGLPVVAVGLFISARLIKVTGAMPFHPIEGMLDGDLRQVLLLYFLACVMAPVLEETMFRGALFHHLRRRWGWLASAALVSFIFAIIHPQGWVALPVLGSIALVLAALREWRGSLLASMTAHSLNNFIALTIGLLLFR